MSSWKFMTRTTHPPFSWTKCSCSFDQLNQNTCSRQSTINEQLEVYDTYHPVPTSSYTSSVEPSLARSWLIRVPSSAAQVVSNYCFLCREENVEITLKLIFPEKVHLQPQCRLISPVWLETNPKYIFSFCSSESNRWSCLDGWNVFVFEYL